MQSLKRLASVVSYAVGWGSKDDVSSDDDDDTGNEQTDSLIDQILTNIYTKEDEDNVPSYVTTSPVKSNIKTKKDNIGTITRLTNKFGVIDDKYYFERVSVHCEGLDVGKKVTYSAFRETEEQEWRVTQIYAVHEENWNDGSSEDDLPVQSDELLDIPEERDEQIGSANHRTVTGIVQLKDGREVVVRDIVKPLKGGSVPRDTRLNLDVVASDFLPMKGDIVSMNCIVEITEETADGSGSVIKVISLKPTRVRAFTGEVAKYSNKSREGMIQEADIVYFNKAACESGYIPKKGDTVEVEAIESDRDGYNWRAISVRPDTICQRNENDLVTRKPYIRIDPDLLPNKGNILVQENTHFGALPASDTYTIEVKSLINIMVKVVSIVSVTNEGAARKKITKHYIDSTPSNLTLISPSWQQCWIESQETVTFCFKYNTKFLGCFSEIFVVEFGNFSIGRLIEWEVYNADIPAIPKVSGVDDKVYHQERSQHSQTYFELRGQRQVIAIVKRIDLIVRGRAPTKRPNFIKVRLGHYEVPDEISEAMCQGPDNRLVSKVDAKDALKKCCPVLSENLSVTNHKIRFHNLLHIAEVDGSIDMCRYTKERVSFVKRGQGTAAFEGCIHKVLKDEVWLKFNIQFHNSYNSEDYNVYFQQARTCFRRCHAALDMCHKNQANLWLFPKGVNAKPLQISFVESDEVDLTENKQDVDMYANRRVKLNWFNNRLNYRQKEAVRNILRGEARPLPYIIFGPPGTGKTVTLVETVLQIYTLIGESRLLIATPSNSSADLIAERLLDSGLLQPGDMIRLVANHLIVDGKVPVKLVPYSATVDINAGADGKTDQNSAFPSFNSSMIVRNRIIIGTCMALGQLLQLGLARSHFSHIVVDEAGQASEPEILIPLSFMAHESGQAILAGDPNQLGPVVQSQLAANFGLSKSLLARLLSRFPYQRDATGFPDTGGYDPRLVTRLSLNYRSLPDILELPSFLFYDSDLEPWLSDQDSYEAKVLERATQHLNLPHSAVIFRGIAGHALRDNDSPSFCNHEESYEVVSYAIQLLNADVKSEDIGIITPYQKQVKRIRITLERLGGPEAQGIKVGSVEEFQGQERMVIIISTVRSLGHAHIETTRWNTSRQLLGFVSNPERLNVSISRARALLIICGDPNVLLHDTYWRSVVKYCIDRNAYLGIAIPKHLQDSDN
ncbi:putative RNA helicase armi [Frankliniella fusca]|uniref:RNA helicase armi n=1 Tax=Frankliniella fusca TaxID=407009 RepID=A0AAE1H3M1_9NEOP|nr:putative RNA helicase armi [Frankliniella fusca]